MRSRARRSHANVPYSRRLRIESLEDRSLLAGVVVGNNSDLVNGNTTSIFALMSNNGGDGISLREAILAANGTAGADQITFNAALAGQVILLGGTELAISESLTIDARALASNVIILANQLLPSRIFNVTATGDYLWGGLTLLGGRANTFSAGAAIRSTTSGSLTLAECIVTGNVAVAGRGGGIYARGPVTLMQSTVTGNTSGGTAFGSGAGVCALLNDITLIQSVVSGNTTTGNDSKGAGLYGRHVVLRESTVSGNTTSGTNAIGGGIFAESVTAYESTVSGNSAQGTGANGGGMNVTRVRLEQSTVSGNSTTGSQAHGGGIFSYFGVTIHESTITNNRVYDATSQGGGVFQSDSMSNPDNKIRNSIVAGNLAGGGGADFVKDPQSLLPVTYSVIGTSVMPTSGDNNVATDAPMLGPLTDNGGRTKTHAPIFGSPAIDAGDPSIVFDPSEFDQRGEPFVRVAGGRIDAGAYEAQLFTLVVDNPADAEDGVHTPGNLTLREALAITNANPGPDLITFAALSGATIALGGTELEIRDSVTIDARPLAENVTIDAGLDSRIVNITDAAPSVTLAGLHLTGGRTTDNGSSGHGGGIRAAGFGNLALIESTVGGNQASGTGTFGGGIYAAGNVVLMQSTISGNSASVAGGVYAIGSLSVYQSTVQFNSASSRGGVASLNNVTVMESTIHGNVATSGGGGIHALGDVTLFDSTISGNHSEGGLGPGAGGIYTNGNVTITRSTITNNRSAQTIPTAGGVLQLNAVVSVSFTIDGSIVAGNAAIIGGVEIAHDDDGELAVNYSLIGTGVVPTSGGNNINTNDPQLGPLTFNGGLTETHAPLAGSPVLNAGDPGIVFDPGEFDQRGEPFVRVALGRIDIGAVEVQDPVPALLGDYNTNGVVDAADYVIWRKTLGSIVPSYSCADGDGDGTIDQDDCGVWRAHFGQTLPIGAGGGSGAGVALGASSAEAASEDPASFRHDLKPSAGPVAKSSESDTLQAMVTGGTHANIGIGAHATAAQSGARWSVAGGGRTFVSRASTGSAETRDAATWGSLSETPNDAALVAWLASWDRKPHARRNEHSGGVDEADADAGNDACTASSELADVALALFSDRTF